jgi:hypothetical protein
MPTRLVWLGDGARRMEVAHVEHAEPEFLASGAQLGVVYELRYQLKDNVLRSSWSVNRYSTWGSTVPISSILAGPRSSTLCR